MWSFLKKHTTKPQGMVGISINQAGIVCAHVIPGAGKPEIKQCNFIPCQGTEGCIAALSKCVEEHGMAGADCTYILQPADYRLVLIDTPTVTGEKELREAARWAAMDFVDFPSEEVAVDIFESPVHSGRKSKTYVIITRVSLLKDIAKVIKDAGLHLVRIDIMELALCSALGILQDDRQGFVTLYLGKRNIHILLSKDKTLYLERNLESDYLLTGGLNEADADETSKVMTEVQKDQEADVLQPSMPEALLGLESDLSKVKEIKAAEGIDQLSKEQDEQEYLVIDTDSLSAQDVVPLASDQFIVDNVPEPEGAVAKFKETKLESPKAEPEKLKKTVEEKKEIERPAEPKQEKPKSNVESLASSNSSAEQRSGLLSELIATKLRQGHDKEGGEA